MEIDLSNKCRVCLSENEEMHNLQDELEDGISLLQVFTSTTSFEIDENDGLSCFICKNCASIIIDFHNLKTVYKENESQIKTLLAKAEECSLNGLEHIEITFDQIPQAVVSQPEPEAEQIKIEIYSNDEDQVINDSVEHDEDSVLSTEACRSDVDFTCVECGDCFLSEIDIQNHLATEHQVNITVCREYNETNAESNDSYKCKICYEVFTVFEEWQKHIKLHKKNVCEICGARFTKKSYLEDHKETHTSEKKHVCSYCNKAFKRRTVLVKHKKLHTHPRQCVCERCGRAFNARSTLNTHMMLVHQKARNYKCLICGMKFSLKATLEKHLRRHENKEREFFCTECPLAYKDKSSLDRHIFVKHSGLYKNVICNNCGKKYTTASNLYKHKKNCNKVPSQNDVVKAKSQNNTNEFFLEVECEQMAK